MTTIAAPVILHYSDPEVQTGIAYGAECTEGESSGLSQRLPLSRAINAVPSMLPQSPLSPTEKSPVFLSYSSSDDEQDFFDANEEFESAEE